MKGSSDARRFDAIVVGAALGGLASAAILANRGWRVAVVDALPQVGARVGAVESGGYWIGWGHRDGHGIGDLAFFPVHTSVAAKQAGVELRLRPFMGSSLRVHWLPEGRAAELPADTLLPESGDPLDQMRELCRFFGDVGEADVDRVAREILDVFTRLAAIEDEEAWRLVPVRMGDWLSRNVVDPAARRVILQQLECMPFTPSSETSLGRFILHRRHVHGEPVVPDDYEVGGMQGVIAPFARGITANGGELWLGWKPLEILLEDDEVRGVVALEREPGAGARGSGGDHRLSRLAATRAGPRAPAAPGVAGGGAADRTLRRRCGLLVGGPRSPSHAPRGRPARGRLEPVAAHPSR